MESKFTVLFCLLALVALVNTAPFEEKEQNPFDVVIWHGPTEFLSGEKVENIPLELMIGNELDNDRRALMQGSDFDEVAQEEFIRYPSISLQAKTARVERDVPRTSFTSRYFRKVDGYGKCPSGYRKDKRGNCRQIW